MRGGRPAGSSATEKEELVHRFHLRVWDREDDAEAVYTHSPSTHHGSSVPSLDPDPGAVDPPTQPFRPPVSTGRRLGRGKDESTPAYGLGVATDGRGHALVGSEDGDTHVRAEGRGVTVVLDGPTHSGPLGRTRGPKSVGMGDPTRVRTGLSHRHLYLSVSGETVTEEGRLVPRYLRTGVERGPSPAIFLTYGSTVQGSWDRRLGDVGVIRGDTTTPGRVTCPLTRAPTSRIISKRCCLRRHQ